MSIRAFKVVVNEKCGHWLLGTVAVERRGNTPREWSAHIVSESYVIAGGEYLGSVPPVPPLPPPTCSGRASGRPSGRTKRARTYGRRRTGTLTKPQLIIKWSNAETERQQAGTDMQAIHFDCYSHFAELIDWPHRGTLI